MTLPTLLCRYLGTGVAAVVVSAALAQDHKRATDDPLIEIDLLDPADSPIRRYALTARHAPAREVPIPDSQKLFCTLSHEHNVLLSYYRDIDTWVFQITATESARRAAGGIATCLDLSRQAT